MKRKRVIGFFFFRKTTRIRLYKHMFMLQYYKKNIVVTHGITI